MAIFQVLQAAEALGWFYRGLTWSPITAETKIEQEARQLESYRLQYGFNGIYLLPVNLYGPEDNRLNDKNPRQ